MNIDPTSLPSVSVPDRRKLPLSAGVYFVLTPELSVEYIGKATNLRRRWTSHACCAELENPRTCSIAWLSVSDVNQLPQIETDLIRQYRPRINVQNSAIQPVRQHREGLMTHDELQAWLDRHNMSRNELAEHLDTTYTTVYRWATGSRSIPSYLKLALERIEQKLPKSAE